MATNAPSTSDPLAFDVNRICRTCLNPKDELQSIFVMNDSTGHAVIFAEMLCSFANVQVENDDGLPGLICIQCVHEISRAYTFKQVCEQSDRNLRRYLGKPIIKTEPNSIDNKSNETKKMVAKPEDAMLITKTLKRGTTNQCNVCQKQFIHKKLFRKHLKTHIEERPFKCKLCARKFTEENYLNNHMRTHLPDDLKPHECNVCQRRFIHITLLNKHKLKHSDEKPFICKVCNKGCYAENSLLKHMKIHEKKQGDLGLLKHICDYCKTEFPDSQALSVHIKQHTGDRPFVCNICAKCFPQRFNLELHLRTHTGERPFQCEVCNNSYVSKASLKIHMRTHTNERPFVCNFCGKAFRQSGDLTSHKRLHGTDKPIECNICHKRFTTAMKLKYHTRNHTGERPYVCPVCNRGFTVNTILLRHMRVHSGERPYVCVTCGKAFSQSSTLNTHMKVHQNEKPANNTVATVPVAVKYENNTPRVPSDEQKYNHPQPHHLLPAPGNSASGMMHHQTGVESSIQRMLHSDQHIIVHENVNNARLIQDPANLLSDTSKIFIEDSRIIDPTTQTHNPHHQHHHTNHQPGVRLLTTTITDNRSILCNENLDVCYLL